MDKMLKTMSKIQPKANLWFLQFVGYLLYFLNCYRNDECKRINF